MIELAPEQRLALVFGPRELRHAHASLLQFDAFLAKSVTLVREPILGQIRLGWWREQIGRLPSLMAGPDPLLAALDDMIRHHHVQRDDLIALVNAWETMLEDPAPSGSDLIEFARARGGSVFRLASAISGTAINEATDQAGTLWALVDFARHCADTSRAQRALALAAGFVGVARVLPGGMRPFAILARFAERDALRGFNLLTPPGSPRRIVQAWKFVLGLS